MEYRIMGKYVYVLQKKMERLSRTEEYEYEIQIDGDTLSSLLFKKQNTTKKFKILKGRLTCNHTDLPAGMVWFLF